MSTEQQLTQRASSRCELCTSKDNLSVYLVPPRTEHNAENCALICKRCLSYMKTPESANFDHWRCLNDSMWSHTPAIQVLAWRQLNYLSSVPWAQDLLAMLYLEDHVLDWAKATPDNDARDDNVVPTLDSNGAVLRAGDTVTVIKDLVVKGANFTAKRGTAVRNISLAANPEHIEGRVNGTRVVLLSCFLKKSN